MKEMTGVCVLAIPGRFFYGFAAVYIAIQSSKPQFFEHQSGGIGPDTEGSDKFCPSSFYTP